MFTCSCTKEPNFIVAFLHFGIRSFNAFLLDPPASIGSKKAVEADDFRIVGEIEASADPVYVRVKIPSHFDLGRMLSKNSHYCFDNFPLFAVGMI